MLLNNKLQAAQENLEYKKVPTSTSSIMVESSLLDDFKRILGKRMSEDYVVTREDIEYIGTALIKSEYDKVLHSRSRSKSREAKRTRSRSPLKVNDEPLMSGDDMGGNVLMEKLKDSELAESGADSPAKMSISFSIFNE